MMKLLTQCEMRAAEVEMARQRQVAPKQVLLSVFMHATVQQLHEPSISHACTTLHLEE